MEIRPVNDMVSGLSAINKPASLERKLMSDGNLQSSQMSESKPHSDYAQFSQTARMLGAMSQLSEDQRTDFKDFHQNVYDSAQQEGGLDAMAMAEGAPDGVHQFAELMGIDVEDLVNKMSDKDPAMMQENLREQTRYMVNMMGEMMSSMGDMLQALSAPRGGPTNPMAEYMAHSSHEGAPMSPVAPEISMAESSEENDAASTGEQQQRIV